MELVVPVGNMLSIHRDAVNNYFNDIFTKLPKNTQRAYVSDFNEFVIFCEQLGLPGFTDSMETNLAVLKQYVEALCESPLAYRTIKRRMSALSKFLSVATLPNPIVQSAYFKDFLRLSLAENEKYQLSTHMSVPLTIELLEQINDTIIPDTLLDLRDLALINMMFDSLLRADEVVRVRLEHINRRNQALLVVKAKADQAGKGSYRYLSNTTIAMIDEYIEEANRDPTRDTPREKSDPRRISNGILFRRASNRGHALLPYDESLKGKHSPLLVYSSIYRIWERIRIQAGIPEKITPHSGRIGGAVSLAENGATLPELQLAGGWSSPEMPGHYAKQANVRRGGMAKLADIRKR